jgi:hypothetical protein
MTHSMTTYCEAWNRVILTQDRVQRRALLISVVEPSGSATREVVTSTISSIPTAPFKTYAEVRTPLQAFCTGVWPLQALGIASNILRCDCTCLITSRLHIYLRSNPSDTHNNNLEEDMQRPSPFTQHELILKRRYFKEGRIRMVMAGFDKRDVPFF